MSLLAVNHHYFREVNPGRGIHAISAATLAKQIEILRRHFTIGCERAVLSYIDDGRDGDKVCIFTFDDGLKEQLDALRLLESMGYSAMFFIPVAPLQRPVLLDVHKLHMIRSVKTDCELAELLDRQFALSRMVWDDQTLETQYRYDSKDGRRVKYFLNFVLDPDARRAWVDKLFSSLFGSETCAAQALYMSREEVRDLGRKGMVGTHCCNHVPLASLPPEQMRDEIESSIAVLEEVSGTKVQGISYPYGGKSAVSGSVFEMAAKCGLRYGFTMERGINGKAEGIGAMGLKRVDTNDVAKLQLGG